MTSLAQTQAVTRTQTLILTLILILILIQGGPPLLMRSAQHHHPAAPLYCRRVPRHDATTMLWQT